jgi:hypothetical protein
MADPLARQQLHEGLGLELGHHHDRAADVPHRRDDRDQPGDMARRHRQRRAVAGDQAHARFVVQHAVRDREVGEHRALGRPVVPEV